MARMVTGAELQEAVQDGTFIQGGDAACAEGVKYDFRLSKRVLKAKYGRPLDANQLTAGDLAELSVEPGEVVFVLTEERLVLPKNMVAQLSPKRKLSHAGVLTLGGFTIDPGYQGRLLIGLFNLSSTPWPLIPGKKLIAATFFRLEEGEAGDFPSPAEPLDDFPDELIEVMQKYRPLGAKAVTEALQSLERDLVTLRDEIKSHNQWYTQFQSALKSHDDQIGKMLTGLTAETEARQRGEDKLSQAVGKMDDKFSQAIDKLDRTFTFVRGAAWVIGTIVALILIPLIIAIIQNYLPQQP